MTSLTRVLLIFVTLFLIASCAIKPQYHLPLANQEGNKPKKLVIFFDGTNNDESSYTNVSKLRNLVTLQNQPDIYSIYVAGVGTDFRVLGMALGTGFANDIKQAYEFLTVNYYPNRQDKIYMFGFSRGAYASRALAGLIQVAGIPNLKGYTKQQRKEIVKKIYSTYKMKGTVQERREQLFGKEFYQGLNIGDDRSGLKVDIEFVGIWDTVEALAIPDYEEKTPLYGKKYIDQLCNVKHVAHAISLDDDRARVFTPILLTDSSAKRQCKQDIYNRRGDAQGGRKIEQVFFSGAHSDVGGGYGDTHISGVSMNWMLSKADDYGLVPPNTKVYADPYGKTHDPEASMWFAYQFWHRDLSNYQELLGDELTVHQSVIDRLACIPQECYETQWGEQDDVLKGCFNKKDNGTFEFKQHGKCHLKVDPSEDYDTKDYQCRYDDEPSYPVCSAANEQALPCLMQGAVEIDAKEKHNKTDIKMKKKQNYIFRIELTEEWNDKGICSSPENGRRISRSSGPWYKKAFVYLAKPVSYHLTAGLTELLGQVGNQTIRVGKMARNQEVFSPSQDGELIIRANDPRFGKSFYENNNGKLKLFVIRVH